MNKSLLVAALLALTVFFAEAKAQPNAAPSSPVVVELYTSQGCFSCPRANRLLGEFSRESNVIALTFAVGYWDYLGWTDTFAQPEFVDRQRAYARALRFRGPYTPQLVINGERQVGAGDWDSSRAVFEEVRRLPRPAGSPSRTRSAASTRATVTVGTRKGQFVVTTRKITKVTDLTQVFTTPPPGAQIRPDGSVLVSSTTPVALKANLPAGVLIETTPGTPLTTNNGALTLTDPSGGASLTFSALGSGTVPQVAQGTFNINSTTSGNTMAVGGGSAGPSTTKLRARRSAS